MISTIRAFIFNQLSLYLAVKNVKNLKREGMIRMIEMEKLGSQGEIMVGTPARAPAVIRNNTSEKSGKKGNEKKDDDIGREKKDAKKGATQQVNDIISKTLTIT